LYFETQYLFNVSNSIHSKDNISSVTQSLIHQSHRKTKLFMWSTQNSKEINNATTMKLHNVCVKGRRNAPKDITHLLRNQPEHDKLR
jgi:hypothetical protein